VTITITAQAIERAAVLLAGLLVLALALKFADEQIRHRGRARFNAEQRRLDDERDARRDRQSAEAERLRRRTEPLPGPDLAGEVVRRLAYADVCDSAGRPTEANRQRAIAGQLGALSQLCMNAGDEPDRADWSTGLAGAKRLIGGYLPPLPGWDDPSPLALTTDRTPAAPLHAEEGTPQWTEAVQALADAASENLRPDDFGPGQTGRGVIQCAADYGYAAAPELPAETVEAFLGDYARAVYGQPAERTWPVDLPPQTRKRPRPVGPTDGEAWAAAVSSLRTSVDSVLRTNDFRGLAGRGKSQIVAEIEQRFGFGRLSLPDVSDYVGDYSLAITGREPRRTWPAGTMPPTDPSRVMPLDPALQPDEQTRLRTGGGMRFFPKS
jgi:hypothetical protein